MPSYYNENDPYAGQWLRNLIAAGLIPDGDVDIRSINEVEPFELQGYAQCHFFAGVAGWSLALKLAGWPDDRPVWTGSCPCQPFSTAGKRLGVKDDRHLWPAWSNLIKQCAPPVIFGEQVASAASAGWYDLVVDDLEAQGYACGASVLPALAVGAPHRRDRLWFVAHTTHAGECQRAALAQATPDASGRSVEALAFDPWPNSPTSADDDDESGFCAPVNGVPGGVGRMRAYGNAIVPQVAAEFIKAYMDCRP